MASLLTPSLVCLSIDTWADFNLIPVGNELNLTHSSFLPKWDKFVLYEGICFYHAPTGASPHRPGNRKFPPKVYIKRWP